MVKRLASWKKIYLSKEERLTLIKSMLSSILTYSLSLFPLPAGIARILEHFHRDIMWDGLGGDNKLHLVNWKTVHSSKIARGGLGFKIFFFFDK
jgi:hypothetical protein